MDFLNNIHEKNYNRLIKEYPNIRKADKNSTTVLYLMAGNEELERKVKPYFKGDTFHFPEMFQTEDFPNGLYVLASLTVALYNGNKQCDVYDFSSLDSENLELALNAIKYRFTPQKNIYQVETKPLIIKEEATPRYVSQTEIAEMLNAEGIDGDRRKVSVYIKKGYLPKPQVYVGTVPGWTESVIKEWIEDYKAGKIVQRRNR
jgi:hypothetical protein